MNEYLLWLDLETTGLDPRVCSIIEAAWGVTPLIAPPESLHVTSASIHPGATFCNWEPKAMEMHLASGLAPEIYGKESIEVSIAEYRICCAIAGETKDRYYLAGSSVHFDMSFIQVHMPVLAKRLHYRLFDVSAMRMFMQSLGHHFEERKDKPHRAAQDIKASYALYRDCASRVKVE